MFSENIILSFFQIELISYFLLNWHTINYLGNKDNYVTKVKDNAKFKFQFLNSFYGIIAIVYNNNSGWIELSKKSNYFMIINI